jgi:hypothetical protein
MLSSYPERSPDFEKDDDVEDLLSRSEEEELEAELERLDADFVSVFARISKKCEIFPLVPARGDTRSLLQKEVPSFL